MFGAEKTEISCDKPHGALIDRIQFHSIQSKGVRFSMQQITDPEGQFIWNVFKEMRVRGEMKKEDFALNLFAR